MPVCMFLREGFVLRMHMWTSVCIYAAYLRDLGCVFVCVDNCLDTCPCMKWSVYVYGNVSQCTFAHVFLWLFVHISSLPVRLHVCLFSLISIWLNICTHTYTYTYTHTHTCIFSPVTILLVYEYKLCSWVYEYLLRIFPTTRNATFKRTCFCFCLTVGLFVCMNEIERHVHPGCVYVGLLRIWRIECCCLIVSNALRYLPYVWYIHAYTSNIYVSYAACYVSLSTVNARPYPTYHAVIISKELVLLCSDPIGLTDTAAILILSLVFFRAFLNLPGQFFMCYVI